MVISYWDMVASFVVTGVLNKELFFQSGRELLVVFERLKPVLPGIREAYKDPLVHGQPRAHRPRLRGRTGGRRIAEAYEAFLKRIG